MLRKDTSGPDPKYTNANFTNCFNSGATSSGTWDDHSSGDYYFAIDYGTNMCAPVSVDSLTVLLIGSSPGPTTHRATGPGTQKGPP
jgi:hypothetical protein